MKQKPLWTDTLESAIEDLAVAVGEKKFASELRPDLPADDAVRWLSHCLNGNRREKFSAADLIQMKKIGRRIGCHVLADFDAQETGYERPTPRELSKEIERASADIAAIHAQALQRMQQLQQLQQLLGGPTA